MKNCKKQLNPGRTIMDYETLIDLTSEKLKMNDRQVENFPPSHAVSFLKKLFTFFAILRCRASSRATAACDHL